MTTFEYLSVFVSIVVGLAVVHILRGVMQFFTDPDAKPFWIHTGWLVWLLFFLPSFWWFTFDWRHLETWTFPVFFFVVGYSMLVYAQCVILMPSRMLPGFDYEAYYFRNHRRIFSLWALIMVVDCFDTFLKGPENLQNLSEWFLWYQGLAFLLFTVAAITPNRRYHAFLLLLCLAQVPLWMAEFADVFGP